MKQLFFTLFAPGGVPHNRMWAFSNRKEKRSRAVIRDIIMMECAITASEMPLRLERGGGHQLFPT